MEIILNVFFDVKQESQADFLALLNDMVVKSNREDGCFKYELWQNSYNPYHYELVEWWESKEALAAHAKTPHWIHFNDVVDSMLEHHYEEHHYEELADSPAIAKSRTAS